MNDPRFGISCCLPTAPSRLLDRDGIDGRRLPGASRHREAAA